MSAADDELLERRAARLAKPREDLREVPVLWVAEFAIGESHYAIPLSSLRAAVPLKRVTPTPLSPAHVIGILRYQGQFITAVSLSSILGVTGWEGDPVVLLVVDTGRGKLVALDCEQLPNAISLGLEDVEAARRLAKGPIAEVRVGPRTLGLLDVARLMDRRSGARIESS